MEDASQIVYVGDDGVDEGLDVGSVDTVASVMPTSSHLNCWSGVNGGSANAFSGHGCEVYSNSSSHAEDVSLNVSDCASRQDGAGVWDGDVASLGGRDAAACISQQCGTERRVWRGDAGNCSECYDQYDALCTGDGNTDVGDGFAVCSQPSTVAHLLGGRKTTPMVEGSVLLDGCSKASRLIDVGRSSLWMRDPPLPRQRVGIG